MASTKKSTGSKKRSKSSQSDHSKVIKEALRGAVRQVWSRYSKNRQEAFYNAKLTKPRINKDGKFGVRPNVIYICAHCAGEFKLAQVQCDHIEPIGKTPDFPSSDTLTWDEWLEKVFCDTSNLQILCKPCHDIKTKEDRARLKRGSNV